MSANWDEVAKVSTENLVNTLSQLHPILQPKSRPAGAPDLKTRAEMLIALTELCIGQAGKRPQQDAAMNRAVCDPRLLELLVCPVTKTRLAYDAERQELVSKASRPCLSHSRWHSPSCWLKRRGT